eukprot:PLAT10394.1.p1 GENE.PLAT10394.1~~PLAT10394.1.p1  ORF type:complete len:552 (+),score=257.98 PLAT10394.1:103-1758(+)
MEAFSKLCIAARTHDFDAVVEAVEAGVDVNLQNEFNVSPLYFASLTGDTRIARYLLENGAHFERNRFDSERCLYAALTHEVATLLRRYKAVVRTASPLRDHLADAFDNGATSDITFHFLDGSTVHAHRAVLAARSRRLAQRLRTHWAGKEHVHLRRQKLSPPAFRAILRFLYTDRLQLSAQHVDAACMLLRRLQLASVASALQEAADEAAEERREWVVIDLSPKQQLSHDMLALRDSARVSDMSADSGSWADVIVSIGDSQRPLHSLFLRRSAYLRMLLFDSGFAEAVEVAAASAEGRIATVRIDEDEAIFDRITQYCYSDALPHLQAEEVLPMLQAAGMYMLPKLQQAVEPQVLPFVAVDSVCELYQLAMDFSMRKVELACLQGFADWLDELLDDEAFHQLVRDSAASIVDRQATDSVPLVDEIKAVLRTRYDRTRTALCDDLLHRLGLRSFGQLAADGEGEAEKKEEKEEGGEEVRPGLDVHDLPASSAGLADAGAEPVDEVGEWAMFAAGLDEDVLGVAFVERDDDDDDDAPVIHGLDDYVDDVVDGF